MKLQNYDFKYANEDELTAWASAYTGRTVKVFASNMGREVDAFARAGLHPSGSFQYIELDKSSMKWGGSYANNVHSILHELGHLVLGHVPVKLGQYITVKAGQNTPAHKSARRYGREVEVERWLRKNLSEFVTDPELTSEIEAISKSYEAGYLGMQINELEKVA